VRRGVVLLGAGFTEAHHDWYGMHGHVHTSHLLWRHGRRCGGCVLAPPLLGPPLLVLQHCGRWVCPSTMWHTLVGVRSPMTTGACCMGTCGVRADQPWTNLAGMQDSLLNMITLPPLRSPLSRGLGAVRHAVVRFVAEGTEARIMLGPRESNLQLHHTTILATCVHGMHGLSMPLTLSSLHTAA
jgi:hypothetical protein